MDASFASLSSSSPWMQQARETPSGGVPGSLAGHSVALSRDGNTAIVGAPGFEFPFSGPTEGGTAYVFVRSGTGWTRQAQLFSPSPVAGARFGWSVALSEDGNVAVVGEPHSQGSAYPGAVHVFSRSSTSWVHYTSRFASDGRPGDRFGFSVAVSNIPVAYRVLVGAPSHEHTPQVVDTGAAYSFFFTGVDEYEQELLPTGATGLEYFGRSVAMTDKRAVIGSPLQEHAPQYDNGVVFVYSDNNYSMRWTEQARLSATDRATGDHFGWAVALGDNDTVLIGAPHRDEGQVTDSGAAYVFVPDGTGWRQEAKLTASQPAAGDNLGAAVASRFGIAAIGAPRTDLSGLVDAGRVRVFNRILDGQTLPVWQAEPFPFPATPGAGDQFGFSVAVGFNTLLVGAPYSDASTGDSGAAYVMAR